MFGIRVKNYHFDRIASSYAAISIGAPPLPVIERLLHLLLGELHVLHGGGGVLVAQLLLGGTGVAGLVDVVDAHRMAGGVRGASLHARMEASLVP